MEHDEEGSAASDQESEVAGAGPLLGGDIDTDAYCVLDGFLDNKQRVKFPITTLPVILGRTHVAEGGGDLSDSPLSPSFIGMGKLKALSRQHLKIEYRTKMGTFTVVDRKFVYKPERMKKPPTDRGPGGFYIVTCLGKNSIRVNGELLKQGEQAVLESKSTLKVGNFRLYFLLPEEESTATVRIPLQKRKVITTTTAGLLASPTVHNKKPMLTKSSITGAKTTSTPTKVPTSPGASTTSSTAHGAWPTLQAEIDSLTTDVLLRQIAEAVDNDNWERRHQLIGSTVSYRAVLEAAQDPTIQNLAREGGGVSRHDVMLWIANSSRFGHWVSQMLSKLEDKSYQASITKALIKANFVRTASSGRYIKWLLPSDVDQGVPKSMGSKAGSAVSATVKAPTSASGGSDREADEESANQQEDPGAVEEENVESSDNEEEEKNEQSEDEVGSGDEENSRQSGAEDHDDAEEDAE